MRPEFGTRLTENQVAKINELPIAERIIESFSLIINTGNLSSRASKIYATLSMEDPTKMILMSELARKFSGVDWVNAYKSAKTALDDLDGFYGLNRVKLEVVYITLSETRRSKSSKTKLFKIDYGPQGRGESTL